MPAEKKRISDIFKIITYPTILHTFIVKPQSQSQSIIFTLLLVGDTDCFVEAPEEVYEGGGGKHGQHVSLQDPGLWRLDYI